MSIKKLQALVAEYHEERTNKPDSGDGNVELEYFEDLHEHHAAVAEIAAKLVEALGDLPALEGRLKALEKTAEAVGGDFSESNDSVFYSALGRFEAAAEAVVSYFRET